MIERSSIKPREAIQPSSSVKEMRMEFVAFFPIARLNYCVLLLRAICSGLSHISKSVMLCACVCVENTSLKGANGFFSENKMTCIMTSVTSLEMLLQCTDLRGQRSILRCLHQYLQLHAVNKFSF